MCKASKLGWVLKIICHKQGFWSYASPNAVSAETPPPVVHKKRNMRVWCSGSTARLKEQEESSTPLMRRITDGYGILTNSITFLFQASFASVIRENQPKVSDAAVLDRKSQNLIWKCDYMVPQWNRLTRQPFKLETPGSQPGGITI